METFYTHTHYKLGKMDSSNNYGKAGGKKASDVTPAAAGKKKKASVIPAEKKHVITMVGEKIVEGVVKGGKSVVKDYKNKSKVGIS